MKNIRRIILTRTQLNEIMDNMKTNITFTGSTPTEMGANAKQEYNDAIGSGLKSSAIAFTGKSPRNNATDSTEANIGINTNTPDIGKAVTDAVTNYVNNGGDINKVNVTGNAEDITNGATDESRTFSKRQIEEARLRKIHEGFKFTKKQLKEHFDTDEQWNDEINMFMKGLRRGDYMLDGDTLYVEIFRGQTPDNDPRYAYIRKGENKLHDDHFYMQDSPALTDSQLKDIYYNAGWEDVLPELVDYNGFEMYENKTGINPEPKTFIVSWMAELTAPKKGKVGGNMLIKAVDKEDAEKRFKKRLFANGYNGEPVSFMLIDLKIEEADNVNEGKIKINPENKGKFNATKKRTGKSTEELTHSKNPKTRKRAIFAQNAKKWNKK